MTTETLLIVALRLILPLTILRWPLAGGILALAADALDVVFASLVDLGGVTSYHSLDKYLDTYYLGLEAIVAQRWLALPRWTATFRIPPCRRLWPAGAGGRQRESPSRCRGSPRACSGPRRPTTADPPHPLPRRTETH